MGTFSQTCGSRVEVGAGLQLLRPRIREEHVVDALAASHLFDQHGG